MAEQHWDMFEYRYGNYVGDEDLLNRALDVYAVFCGKPPPAELVVEQGSDRLQAWILNNVLPQFNYVTAISIIEAAEAIVVSQIDNGYERRF